MHATRPSTPLPTIERPKDDDGNPVEWVTPPTAARLAGISLRTMRRWLSAGLVPHHRRPNGRIIISVTDLENTL